jgi:hypothetical protein
MRGVDMIPLALVTVLAGAVGFRAVQQPRAARPAIAVSPVPAEVHDAASHIVEPTVVLDSGGPVRLAPRGFAESEVFVPSPLSEDILRRIRLGAAGTYMFEMLEDDSALVRWKERRNEPIRIWVDPSPRLADWNPRFAAAARDGIQRWEAANIPVRMAFVVDSSTADVRVRWVEQLDDKLLGVARTVRNQHYWIVRAEIIIALRSDVRDLLKVGEIQAIASHEAGHMLGLGHSNFGLDVMAPGYYRQIEPSPADLMTMRLLYTIPAGRFR